MLKDITLGQYFPSNTVVHRLDPRTKIVLCIVYIICLFQANTWLAYGLVLALTLSVMALSKIKPSAILKGLKPLIIIIALTCLLNLFYTKGTPIREGWPITYEGIERAVQMILRIVLLIAGTFILTYTTSPIELTDGLELLKARGADFESGNLIQRAKALLPVLVPLFVSAFRRADELAVAMESRCYHGGEGRTRMNPLKMKKADAFAFILGALVLAGFIILRILL